MSQLLDQPCNSTLNCGLLLFPFILHIAAKIMNSNPLPQNFCLGVSPKFCLGVSNGFLFQTQIQAYPLLQTPQISTFHSFLIYPGNSLLCTFPYSYNLARNSFHTTGFKQANLFPSFPAKSSLLYARNIP